jgi:hypothetical protein
MEQQEAARLIILAILRAGRMTYADALAAYAERTGRPDEFARLVHGLVAEKMIGYTADWDAGGPMPVITAIWLRPRGEARLNENGPVA